MQGLLSACQQFGIGLVATCIIGYLFIFLVKTFVNGMIDQLKQLVSRIEIFTVRVREEHDQSAKQHEALMKQHNEIITNLGRINGYKR